MNARHGHIEAIEKRGSTQIIRVKLPWRRCLATLRICVPGPRVVPRIPCTSCATSRPRPLFRKKSSHGCKGGWWGSRGNMESPQFNVVVQALRISPEDLVRAMRATASELPKLTEERKTVARGFKMSQEQYARQELARLYTHERMSQRGRQLGETVSRILEALGPGYRLAGVTSQMTKLRWVLTVRTPTGDVNVFVPRDLADDVVDWGPRGRRSKNLGRSCSTDWVGKKLL